MQGRCQEALVARYALMFCTLKLKCKDFIVWGEPRPMINKPAPFDRDYNRDPNIYRSLKRGGLLIMGLH